jgi:branched-chain amino acid transport system substrate-binding protein
MNQVKGAAEGAVTSFFWSTELDNSENRELIDAFQKGYSDEDTGEPIIPNGYAVQMWDAMLALDAALRSTDGATHDADALVAALETVAFKSPRGSFAFDKSTHAPVQDIYIRQVKLDTRGKPINAIVDKFSSVADPRT